MITYLERGLVEMPCFLALCTSEQAFRRELNRRGIPPADFPHFLPPKAVACVHHFCNEYGERIEVVCIDGKQWKSASRRRHAYQILVHEAVHVWQTVRDMISESDPSIEFEAYSIESISGRLFKAFDEQMKRG